tara:strand:- start:105 stop:755 length:651 start_codon:yes stop_codon:yes gene_type:complete
MKYLFVFLLVGLMVGCGDTEDNEESLDIKENTELSFDEKRIQDSLRAVEEQKIADEIKLLKDIGALGKWDCTLLGYESEIMLLQQSNRYSSRIDFKKSLKQTKTEELIKKGNRYYVKGNKVKEYYEILDNGNLELADNRGTTTVAKNIMPGNDESVDVVYNKNEAVGKDVFYIARTFSKSNPNTIKSDAKIWTVYYSDINTTFEVDKATNIILKAN